jgi:NAD(P)-dependent dehydrogenase (short-subunit alcohol dehydrogenase family)
VLDEAVLVRNREEILGRYGRIDALLNAAGGNMPGANISPAQTFFDLDLDEFDKVVRLNLTGTVLPSRVFLKPMVEQKKGNIIISRRWPPSVR